MPRRMFPLSAALTLIILAGPAFAQGPRRDDRADYPRLRAALHEMREARRELMESRDAWPPGHRERASRALDDGIDSIKTILSVNDVDNFRGVDRNPDFYKRFKDYPRLRAALADLRDARDELRSATADFRGMKERALDDIEVAIGEIVMLTRGGDRSRRPR
jgi:hypothetical protein